MGDSPDMAGLMHSPGRKVLCNGTKRKGLGIKASLAQQPQAVNITVRSPQLPQGKKQSNQQAGFISSPSGARLDGWLRPATGHLPRICGCHPRTSLADPNRAPHMWATIHHYQRS